MRTRSTILFAIAIFAVTTPRASRAADPQPIPKRLAGSVAQAPAVQAPIPPLAAPAIPIPASSGIVLAELEHLALQHNPTLSQAAALIEAARGKAFQAGLPLNPTISTQVEQIGAARTGGEATWFLFQQEIVTGGKLRLSRLKYDQEALAAEVQAQAQRIRVVNAIAEGYFDVLAAQRSLENHRRLKANAEDALKTTEQMANVGQANEPDLLQAKVEVQRATVALRTAETRLRRDWEKLAVQTGVPTLPLQPLSGMIDSKVAPLVKDEQLSRLLSESPEMAMAVIEVKRDQITLKREQREPIPNITLRGGYGYNYETRNQVGTVGIAIRLPLWDRNQGTIRQAQADLTRGNLEVTRVELDLRRRYAEAYSRYEIAKSEVDVWRDDTLPTAQKVYDLYLKNFKDRRAAWPQVLVAQRTVFQLNEDYTRSLAELRRAEVEIRGLLLTGGLTAPRDPTPAGHINATPKPR